MKTLLKSSHKSIRDNAFARKAFEEIHRIEEEAKQKKLAQRESLISARAAILERINELEHQLKQLDMAIASVTGLPAPTRERAERKNWTEMRERVGRWMEGRRGEKFAAGDLVREFPELDGLPISMLLKPLVEAGSVKTDASAGPRRTKYFVQ